MATMMRAVDKRRYYFSINSYGKIMDAIFAYEDEAVGRPVDWYEKNKDAVWAAHFKLYNETEDILRKAEDPDDFSLMPLYRWLGQDEEDYIFSSREEALKEYESQINQAVADRLYDL